MGRKHAAVLVLVFLALAFSAGAAEEFSGFLGDYSQLKPFLHATVWSTC